jgi:glycolate oxidase FAD binding subunit
MPMQLACYFPELPTVGSGVVKGCFALIRLEGGLTAVTEKRALLQIMCDDEGLAQLTNGDSVVARLNAATSFIETLEDVWLVQVPPAAASDVIANIDGNWIVDRAGAKIWIRETPGLATEWQNFARKLGGSAVLLHASEQTRRRILPFAPEEPARAELTARVKAAFDPLRLFNPGRMWEGV